MRGFAIAVAITGLAAAAAPVVLRAQPEVAAAGGWSEPTTLIRCYQQPDDATLLRVMSEPRKVVGIAQHA